MSLEKRFVLESDFLTGGSVTSGMRGMLVDWLIQVSGANNTISIMFDKYR